MSGKPAAGVDNTHRKTWDKSEFHEKAKEREKMVRCCSLLPAEHCRLQYKQGANSISFHMLQEKAVEDGEMDARKRKRLERDPLHQGLIVSRANLKPRDFQIDLASKINKQQMQSLAMPLNQQAGYYCDVCDCVLKDSLSYLDHLNGKWHNRALGMSMRVERSTAEQVRVRLEELKKKKGKGGSGDEEEEYIPDGLSKAQIEKEEQQHKEEQRKKEAAAPENDTKEEEEEEEEVDPEFATMMGFSGFGTSKKN